MLECVGQRVQGLRREVSRVRRHETQVPFRQRRKSSLGDRRDHGRQVKGLQRLGQHDPVPHRAAPVGDDAGHPHVSFEGGEAP